MFFLLRYYEDVRKFSVVRKKGKNNIDQFFGNLIDYLYSVMENSHVGPIVAAMLREKPAMGRKFSALHFSTMHMLVSFEGHPSKVCGEE